MSEKNYDPRMHSAEHILNQVMVRNFNCNRSFNAHIESRKSKCDYYLSKALSQEDLENISKQVNEIILSNLSINESYVSRKDASLFVDLSKLPEDAGNSIRIISVGDFDHCACIGPHVKNTSEIGKFEIISSDFSNGVARIRFKLEKK